MRIIFCAGAATPNLSVLNQAYDLLIGVDGGAAVLVQHGYIPDWAIGDFDSTFAPQAKNILKLQPEKDDTDLEAALFYILSKYTPTEIEQVMIIGAFGAGRLDHLLANFYLAHQARFKHYFEKFYFIEQYNTLKFYSSGYHIIVREQDKKYLSFIGLTSLHQLSLYDVKYPIQKRDYYHPIALISNEFLTNTMQFELNSGILAVIQSSDAGSLKTNNYLISI